MKVRIKRLSEMAIIPSYAKEGDAGLDLTSISRDDSKAEYISYGTGLALEIPIGYVGLLFPRSSVSEKDLILANCVGVVDAGYRGEVKLRFKRVDLVYENYYEVGDKVGQLIVMPRPYVELEEVEELVLSERGEGGFGSSGK